MRLYGPVDVRNIKNGARLGRDFDVYIGRAAYGFPESPWHNPFRVGTGEGDVATRELAVGCYCVFLSKSPELVERIRAELVGKSLGCWCKPLACHGDVIARVAYGADPLSLVPPEAGSLESIERTVEAVLELRKTTGGRLNRRGRA